MATPTPVSVLLPTMHPTDVIADVARQLQFGDELLVICDAEDDPVARAWPTVETEVDGELRLVVAGEPHGCSGKANAIAAGMAAARHDRLVWTDDDFHHPPEWLDELRSDYERRGPVTEPPVFEGRDPLSIALEPLYAIVGTASTVDVGVAWGGAVCFDRSDLPDEAAFEADLQRTISDDGLLTDVLPNVTGTKRPRTVPVGGSIRASLERHVRFSQIVRYHDPVVTVGLLAGLLAFTVGSLLFPLLGAALSTSLVGITYARFGVRRWTVLLAFPVFLAMLPLAVYGLLVRSTFVWGGRRYCWHSKFDVEIVDDA